MLCPMSLWILIHSVTISCRCDISKQFILIFRFLLMNFFRREIWRLFIIHKMANLKVNVLISFWHVQSIYRCILLVATKVILINNINVNLINLSTESTKVTRFKRSVRNNTWNHFSANVNLSTNLNQREKVFGDYNFNYSLDLYTDATSGTMIKLYIRVDKEYAGEIIRTTWKELLMLSRPKRSTFFSPSNTIHFKKLNLVVPRQIKYLIKRLHSS